MTNKLWNVLVIIYYISALILVFPFFGLYLSSTNSYRRGRNRRKVIRILRQKGLPKELYKEIGKTYRKQLRTFTLWQLMKAQKDLNLSGKDDENSKSFNFVKSVPSINTFPRSGRSRPARIFNKVVFPEPDDPVITTNSPFLTAKSTPLKA